MSKKLMLLFLLSGICMIGQTKKNPNLETYTSRKKVYEIKTPLKDGYEQIHQTGMLNFMISTI